MALRSVLASLIVVSTVAFVIGSAIERSDGHHGEHAQPAASGESSREVGGETGESADHRAAEGGNQARAGERKEEFKPFGVDIEAAPFVVLAAVVSVALALAAWLRPQWIPLLALGAVAMLVFALLDVREVVYQGDEASTGLAVLAAVIAALHLAAAAVAIVMVRDARGDRESPGPAATMRA